MAEENEISKNAIKSEKGWQPELYPEGTGQGQELADETKIATPDFKISAELDLDKIDQVEKLDDVEVIEPQKIGRSEFGEEKYDVPAASAVEFNDKQKAENLLEMLNGEVPLNGDMHAVMEQVEDLSQS